MHLEGHLAELDANPLIAPSGHKVKAADALVVFRGIWHRTWLRA